MPKGILSFDLPEEEHEFRMAQEGAEWRIVLMDILEHLRSQLKYHELSGEKAAAYEEFRELIWNTISDRGLKLD